MCVICWKQQTKKVVKLTANPGPYLRQWTNRLLLPDFRNNPRRCRNQHLPFNNQHKPNTPRTSLLTGGVVNTSNYESGAHNTTFAAHVVQLLNEPESTTMTVGMKIGFVDSRGTRLVLARAAWIFLVELRTRRDVCGWLIMIGVVGWRGKAAASWIIIQEIFTNRFELIWRTFI